MLSNIVIVIVACALTHPAAFFFIRTHGQTIYTKKQLFTRRPNSTQLGICTIDVSIHRLLLFSPGEQLCDRRARRRRWTLSDC